MVLINAGIKIRQNNMVLAKSNPSLLRGLSLLQGEQAKELGLANQLTGDPAKDPTILTALQRQFQAGISANRGTQAEVSRWYSEYHSVC